MADLTRDDDKRYVASGWEDADKEAQKGGKWLKLESGEAVELVTGFAPPQVFEKDFDRNGKSELVKRWELEVYIPSLRTMKTWEMSKTVFQDIKRQREIRGEQLPNSLLRISRKGSELTTKYTIDYLRPLSTQEIDERNGAMLQAGHPSSDLPF